MRNMMDLSSINIYQLHSVRFLRLMRLHRESELKRQNAEDIKTFSVGPSMVHPSILYPRSFGIQCALGPDISGLFPTQAVKHWQILQKKKRDVFVSKRGYVIFSTGELTPMFPPEGTSWNTKNVDMSWHVHLVYGFVLLTIHWIHFESIVILFPISAQFDMLLTRHGARQLSHAGLPCP